MLHKVSPPFPFSTMVSSICLEVGSIELLDLFAQSSNNLKMYPNLVGVSQLLHSSVEYGVWG